MKMFDRYSLHVSGRCAATAAAWMGLYFFLNILYYLGLGHVFALSAGVLAVRVILPLVLSGGFVLLLKLVRLPQPVVYLALGLVLCLLSVIESFGAGAARGVISLVWLIAAVAVTACVFLDVLKGKRYMVIVFTLMPLFWILVLVRELQGISLSAVGSVLPEFGRLGLYMSMAFLTGAVTPARHKE